MTRTFWAVIFTGLWSSTACAQSPDRRSPTQSAGVDLTRGTTSSLAADPLALRADSLVRAGRPWRATLLLGSALRNPSAAPPAIRLAAARAAAAWNGWPEVDRILHDAPWIDTQFDGEGRELLVRSALERGQSPADDARTALASARSDAQRVVRRVLLARAYDRANMLDSAASSYAQAATQLPAIADWLRLRTAGAMADNGARSSILSRVTTPVARARVPWTDAQARERTGDFVGAARLYRSVSAEPAALRVEGLASRDNASRAALAQRIATYLAKGPPTADVRLAIEVLDKSGVTLGRPQELVVARAAAQAGLSARAVTGFRRALALGALESRDRLTYAEALSRAGRPSDAVRLYDQIISSDSSLAPMASYQRARTLLQTGNGAEARSSLRALVTKYGSNAEAVAPAMLLLADLQVDDGDLTSAARVLSDLSRKFPRASQTPLARFREALLAWNADAGRAAAAFDSLATLYPNDDEALAARYWAARAYDRAGKSGDAAKRWSAIVAEAPLTYYGLVSARRLHREPFTPPGGADTAAHVAWVDSAVARVRTLQVLGMDVEAHFEIDALAEHGEQPGADVAAITQALETIGESARALRIATRAIERGGAQPRAVYRAAYPIVHQDALIETARAASLDPALVAGLIRQESTWNPNATSPAGARGLMQIMPSVGATLASARGYPVWSPALLYDPDVSLQLGTAHLASSLRSEGDSPARALAAYNAGAARVARWVQRPGASDAELFTEWIPFTETRDYVRVVQRNAAVYRALYGWR